MSLRNVLKYGSSIMTLSLAAPILLVPPAFAFDDTAPVVTSSQFSPDSVDLSTGPADISFTLSATDQTGVKRAAVLCFTQNSVRSLYLDIQPGNDASSTVAKNSFTGASLPIVSFSGDPRSFTITVTATLPQGLFPGRHSCYTDIYDSVGTVGHWKNYDLDSFESTRGSAPKEVKEIPVPESVDQEPPSASKEFAPLFDFDVIQRTLARSSRGAVSLTRTQQDQVTRLVLDAPAAEKFICTAIRNASGSNADNILLRKQAKAVCDFAKKLRPELSVWVQSKPTTAMSFMGRILMNSKTSTRGQVLDGGVTHFWASDNKRLFLKVERLQGHKVTLKLNGKWHVVPSLKSQSELLGFSATALDERFSLVITNKKGQIVYTN